MDVRLLGELEATADDGAPVVVRGAKQRALLALLALHRGEAVPFERLIDGLWGDDPPGNPGNALQALVAQLRRAVGAGAVATTDAGYALAVAPDDVDVVRFERLVMDGRRRLEEGDAAGAAAVLGDALRLCRGEPLAEFTFAEFAVGERARLDELIVAATEARVEADLALGRHAELVGELEVLVRRHPLRERLWELRMLALYRAGRQADALRAFGEARETLVEELGLEPGQALRTLESQVLAQDPSLHLADRVAPGGARPPAAGNLRAALTSFVGRADELDRLADAVGAARLVTLIGPGGAGKTRLALEAAGRLVPECPDGVWMVELAGVRGAEGVAPAVAAALGPGDAARDADGEAASTVDLLVRRLRDHELVIVLDNCEHVIGEAAAVAEALLGSVPGLRLIATSREPLGVPGEVLLAVGGLAPDAATEVFVERARAVRADFAADDGDAALIADVCQRLDGLPLALELAAARLHALPLAQLAARLDDRFRVLTGGARTALPRQQTLRAVVDWSYDLLFEDERRLFDRLSVFTGGCDLEAVEAVCADDVLPAGDVLDLLSRLVDKSLVNVAFDAQGGARYSQLQTLWEYARERLAESGAADAIRARHAAWYGDIAAGGRLGLRGATGPAWRDKIVADLDNLRGALDWFAERGDADAALALVEGLAWIWYLQADPYEGERWLEDAMAVVGEATPAQRARALVWHGFYTASTRGPSFGLAEVQEAVAVLRREGDADVHSEALLVLAELLNRVSELDAALEVLAEARGLFAATGNEYGLGVHDMQLAGSLAPLGRLEEAEAAARSCVDRFRAIGEVWVVFEGLALLAGLSEAGGDLEGAAQAYRDLMVAGDAAAMRGYDVLCLIRLGAIAARQGDDVSAESLFARGAGIPRRPAYNAAALIGRAGAARRLGDLDGSRASLDEALRLYRSLSLTSGIASALTGLAWWALAAGDLDAAAAFADEGCVVASGAADGSMATSAAIAAAAVAHRRSGDDADRDRLAELIRGRAANDGGRFVAMFGGAVGASLDEADVAALLDSLGIAPVAT